MKCLSELQKNRKKDVPELPAILDKLHKLYPDPVKRKKHKIDSALDDLFPFSSHEPDAIVFIEKEERAHAALRVGVLFSGGPAAGGHNVISGIFDSLKKINPESSLIGFLNGPQGLIDNKKLEISENLLADFRNQGGFDLLGSGRKKIDTLEQFAAAEKTIRANFLDGLIIIGGDDSNTNAALLAEYLVKNGCKTSVIGVPKTIDGDLKNEDIELSFGFDSATKTYSQTIGNLARDALSSRKPYFFIKLMGRSASHIVVECALQTHPNLAFISEEVAAKKLSLAHIVQEISDLICERAKQGKEYGVILIPEGLIEFIPELNLLIKELNQILAETELHEMSVDEKSSYVKNRLSQESNRCFSSIPESIQKQLLLERDAHGNVQVSKIETERLLIEMVEKELIRRKKEKKFQGKFQAQPYFCGYEGRSCFPSKFDAQYGYALGYTATLLVDAKLTGYICAIQKLSEPVKEWQVGGRNLRTMMIMEKRHGKDKPVISKALVDLKGKAFKCFADQREAWKLADDYIYPGPMQFYGSQTLTELVPQILALENQ